MKRLSPIRKFFPRAPYLCAFPRNGRPFPALRPRYSRSFSHSASFRPHTVTCRALQDNLGTTRRRSFPPLNLHRARVRRKSRAPSFKSLYRKRTNTRCLGRRIALRASDTTLRLPRSLAYLGDSDSILFFWATKTRRISFHPLSLFCRVRHRAASGVLSRTEGRIN